MTDTPMTRSSREAGSRANTEKRKPWRRPNALDAPEAPEGYVHRWIRVGLRGADDSTNLSKALREGWEPVMASAYPDFPAPSIEGGKYDGVIGTGGLMLCRMPVETAAERTAYYGDRTRHQQQAVDEELKRNERQFGVAIQIDRRTKVTVGGGNAGL